MTIVVEDGTGKNTSETYVSVAEAKTLLEKRGITDWSDLDLEVQEASLRNATDYMTATYRQRWMGTRVGSVQALDWPRYGVYVQDAYPYAAVASNVVPAEVKLACALLANIASTSELMPTLERAVVSESVGPLSITYDRGSRESPSYPIPHSILTPYLNGGGSASMIGLVRA